VWRWVGIAIGLLALFTALLWQRCGLRGCPDVEQLRGYMPDQASILVDRNGDEISKLYLTRRVVVAVDSIPEVVRNAFIAIEDRRFWDHDGVDWLRVLGAFWRNVKSFEIEEGSSTLTMQLARNVFPEKLPASQKTPWRKLGEARVAKEIEEVYTKEEILGLYLNQIYFGNGAYGIEAAAQEYFGKPVGELQLSEAALLAALPRAPSRYNPRSNREAALEGRALVLDRMAEQGLISAEDAEEAKGARLRLRRGEAKSTDRAPYFVEAVRRQLEEQLGDVLYTGGYTIHTTLDLEAQTILEEELRRQLVAIESGRFGRFPHPTYASVHEDSADLSEGTPYVQVAAVMMDANKGDVLALVGGRDYDESQYNRATQAQRQPGSAFKPFVYAAAIGAGIPPTHRLVDEPIRLALDNRRVWEPKNYDGTYAGQVTMREGLVRSKNVVTVRLAQEIGIHRAIGMAEQLGVAERIPDNPSVVLGTAEVTPLALTAAYATFATLGSRPVPRFVVRVEDHLGTTVWAQEPFAERVLDPAVAYITTNMLQDVVNRGTATAVRGVGYRGPAAGKTGTTQDAADVWFVGFTPERVATIWMGFDRRETVVRGTTGGELTAPVWGRVMRRLGTRSADWTPPPGVETRTVDEFGNVLAENCPPFGPTRTEVFLVGTTPMATCTPDYYYTYYDSLGYPIPPPGADTSDLAWWQRLRERLFRRDTVRDTLGRDTLPRDTLRLRSDSLRRDSLRRDSLRRDTLRRDTLRRDTLRRDTLRRDTIRRDTLKSDAHAAVVDTDP
jgi:penicillin-binding protein 1A